MIHPSALIGGPPESRAHPGIGIPPEIAPDVRIEAYVTVDAGTERPTKIGARSWLMKKAHVGHDALIGEDCEIAPLTCIGGFAELGNGVRVGMSVVIRNRVKIGDRARIGAGAVVLEDVPAGETWGGNPARALGDRVTLDRFWAKIALDEGRGCWNWTGAKLKGGYGQIKRKGRCIQAHRFAYQMLIGPIAEGHHLHHLCANPGCVRPEHLLPVTPEEHSQLDGNAAKLACLQGHPYDEVNTYVDSNGRRNCRACHREAQKRYRQATGDVLTPSEEEGWEELAAHVPPDDMQEWRDWFSRSRKAA